MKSSKSRKPRKSQNLMRHQGWFKSYQVQYLWDGRRRCVYKQKSGGRIGLGKTHTFGERMGHSGGIQAESNISKTIEGGRGEKRVELAEATMNAVKVSTSRQLSVRNGRCGQRIKREEGWEKANQQMWQWEGHDDFSVEQGKLKLHSEESNRYPVLWNSRLERSPGLTWSQGRPPSTWNLLKWRRLWNLKNKTNTDFSF